MTILTNDELQAIRARCEAATPSNLRLMDDGIVIEDDGTVIADFDSNHDDARLYIHARTDIPDLLDNIEHQRRALEWMARRSLSYNGESAENFQSICNLALLTTKDEQEAIAAWNAIPRALTWTTEPPVFGEWNWWRIDTEGRPICRYVYTDGTIDNQMIGRITWQDIGGQWCPVPLPKEPTP